MTLQHKRNLVASLSLSLLLALTACAGAGRTSGRTVEPVAIAVANNTPTTLRSVVVSEATPEGTGSRMGRIEPLTRGSITTIQRRTNAAPLAPRISVVWVTPDGEQHEQILDISGILSQDAASGDTLLFEVGETVTARLVRSSELNPFGP